MRRLNFGGKLGHALRILGIVWGLAAAHTAAAATIWYNGNYDSNDADANQTNIPINEGGGLLLEQNLVYDDFVVPAGQRWSVASVFSHDQIAFAELPTTATWQIRSGMSSGQGGTLLASGDTTATATLLTAANGSNFIDPEYNISAAVTGVTLTSGTYWMAVAPDSPGFFGDQSYIETTSGGGAIGLPPGNDGNSFLNNNLVGQGQLTFAPSSLDFSAGITGTVTLVPEPVCGLVFFAGLMGIARRGRCQGRHRGNRVDGRAS